MLLHSSKLESCLKIIKESVGEIFKVSLISYLFFYLVDNYKIGYVSNFFNLNILLWITIASGILTTWIRNDEPVNEKISKKNRITDYIFIIILGLVSTALIYYKVMDLGGLAWIISGISGVIIILLSILLLSDDFTDDSKEEKSNESWLTNIKSNFKK